MEKEKRERDNIFQNFCCGVLVTESTFSLLE